MISKIADWYRIAGEIDDQTIEKRKLAINGIVTKISESDDLGLICGLVSIIFSRANPKNEAQKSIIELMMSLLCEHQPSLPTDPYESLNILKACALIALGEIVIQTKGKTEKPSDLSVLGSYLFHTSIGLHFVTKERGLRKVLSELVGLTQLSLQKASEIKRRRQSALNLFEKISPDIDAKKAIDITKSAISLIEEQMKIDREELETLWWLRGGFSNILQKSIAEIGICNAAIVCALELADRCLLPSPESAREMVSEAISYGRTKKQMQEIDTHRFLLSIDSTVNLSIVLDSDVVKRLVVGFPDIFSITSFLIGKAEEKSKFILPKKLSPLIVARQVFNERISQRLIHSME
jgi:hypothetical protein